MLTGAPAPAQPPGPLFPATLTYSQPQATLTAWVSEIKTPANTRGTRHKNSQTLLLGQKPENKL